MKASLNFLHHQSNDWNRELEFYKDEIAVLAKRLEEAASKNTSKEILAQVEHFQNKFIMLREQVDVLKHDVSAYAKSIEDIVKDKPEHTNEKSSSTNEALLERVNDLAKSLANTRFEFNGFLANTL